MRVLIIEDEPRLARNIGRMLQEQAAYAVDHAPDGEDGLHLALTSDYDLIILDLMLPKLPGLDLLRRLRDAGRRTPVLILTARNRTEDVVRGLNAGSDDYLTKPFDMAELLARCQALIRRNYDRSSPTLIAGQLQIDTVHRTVTAPGRTEGLPAMEFRLLEYLALRAGQVVSKQDIVEHLYDFEAERFSNVVEVYVWALRKRYGPEVIRTIRNQGYILTGQTA